MTAVLFLPFTTICLAVEEVDSDDDKDEIGGLFKVVKKTKRNEEKKSLLNGRDCSLFLPENIGAWEADMEEVVLCLMSPVSLNAKLDNPPPPTTQRKEGQHLGN